VCHQSTAAYGAAAAVATSVVSTGLKCQIWSASTLMKATRHAVDSSHSTLRSRRSAGLSPARTSTAAAPSATAPAAAKASWAPVVIPGHSSVTAINPATTARTPPT